MNWRQLVKVLSDKVPSGRVTTYAQVSNWAYGVPNRNQPVGSMLVGARNHGHAKLTNRVVGTDGTLAETPDGHEQQRQQLVGEGIPFINAANVIDLTKVTPVVLPRAE